MNVLQLQLNDVVFFGDSLIRITNIEDYSSSRMITYDVLDNSLFPVKIAWSFYVVFKNDFDKDFFNV